MTVPLKLPIIMEGEESFATYRKATILPQMNSFATKVAPKFSSDASAEGGK